jgi:glutamyl-tRNA(Gln) amidotransferase subunit D
MDIVRITTNKGTYEGTLLPAQGSSVVLKLRNGYNVGIRKGSIIKEEKLGKFKHVDESRSHTHLFVHDEQKPLVCILHLGGTIAAKVDYATGATVAQFHPDELLTMFPELRSEARIESLLVRNMQSDHMQPGQYNVVANAIAEELAKNPSPKGIIVSHGTDTMQYTAAALSFILENCPVPVILVGSQRSSDRGSSDAALNLLSAVHFIVNTEWTGVGVCMHKGTSDTECWVLPGTNVAKMHTARRDAFRPVNALEIGTIEVRSRTITYSNVHSVPRVNNGSFRVRTIDPSLKVGLLKTHPGIHASEFSFYTHYDGLVIEGTGLGHLPIEVIDEETKENAAIFEAVKELATSIPVAMTSQCPYGAVSLQVYSPGRKLQDAGVLGHGCDMTSTCAYMKLWWLLSNERDRVRELYGQNLRGEISEHTSVETYMR